ncbi:hypothetical protein A3850_001460 [Lewinella sp. 4G2]|nr:hypothetical protein A3850_001460 [Lewinella sp. 4G2]
MASCEDDDNNRSVVGSGTLITETRDVPAFTGISVSGSTEVTVINGTPFTVQITADDNVMDMVETEVNNGELDISVDANNVRNVTLLATITMPSLNSINGSGATTYDIGAFSQTNSDLSVDLSGAAKATITGAVFDDLNVNLSGASEAFCFSSLVNSATVDLSGSSTLEVNVEELLTGEVSGSSTVRYRNNPEVTVATSGSSSVVDAN